MNRLQNGQLHSYMWILLKRIYSIFFQTTVKPKKYVLSFNFKPITTYNTVNTSKITKARHIFITNSIKKSRVSAITLFQRGGIVYSLNNLAENKQQSNDVTRCNLFGPTVCIKGSVIIDGRVDASVLIRICLLGWIYVGIIVEMPSGTRNCVP